jgi:RNA recognition motif-containing protein
LPPFWTDQNLFEAFESYGLIKSAYIIVDPQTDCSRGFGYVEMEDPETSLYLANLETLKYRGVIIKVKIHKKNGKNNQNQSKNGKK